MKTCDKCKFELNHGLHIDMCEQITKLVEQYKNKEREDMVYDLCLASNYNCIEIEKHWLYEVFVRHFDLSPSEYYNDWQSLPKEDIDIIGKINYKPVLKKEKEMA